MRLGIDLGGTKTEVIVLDEAGQPLLRRRIPTQRENYESVLNTIITLVTEAEAEVNTTCSVGVGIPGTIDSELEVIKNANLTVLNGNPLGKDLAARLDRPVRIMNDANCFALSEAVDGAGAGAPVVFGVIVGTGCGGGIIINGQPLLGLNGLSGEWGHNRLNDPTEAEIPGHPCYCGKTGCVETWISGTAFENDYERRSGTRLKGLEVVALAESGDEVAEHALRALESRMARALSQIINIIDPNVIVLGGGLSNINRLYDNVPKLWDEWVFSATPAKTALRKNLHGDSSGVRGAAWLWPGK
jgi:fructokinase